MQPETEKQFKIFCYRYLQTFEYTVYRKIWENSDDRDDADTTNMFNTSNHSSERPFPRDRSQRVPSTQKSRSNRSRSSSRHSDPRPQIPKIAIPAWVHCDKCFDSYDQNPHMLLLSCGHILCRKCLRFDKCCNA